MVILTAGTADAPEFNQDCWQTQQDYASRIGAEWTRLDLDRPYDVHAKVFQYLQDLADATPCLLLEWDIEIKPAAPSIFEVLDFNHFHLRKHPYRSCTYNLGVMAGMPHHFRELESIRPAPVRTRRNATSFWEMKLNQSMIAHGFQVTPLDPVWNADRHDGYFIHHIS